jgi:SsrA-binding protein
MAEKKTNKVKGLSIKNKRASFDYLLLDNYTAGIVLTGTEIKSIRAGKAALVDTFCFVHNGEVWVKNMYVAEYSYGSYNNHVARRDRKLLLNRREIRKLQQDMKSPGFTLIPTLLFIDENGRAKLDIHLCRGKKEYDKRQTLKEKEDRREMDRQFKKY